jgi:hypothetical protein
MQRDDIMLRYRAAHVAEDKVAQDASLEALS